MTYAAIDDFKNYLGIEVVLSTLQQNVLDMALTNACAIIDSHTHRTYSAAADSTRYHDAATYVEGRRLWLDGDLCQLTSVTNGDGQAVPLPSIAFDPANEKPYFGLTIKRSSNLSWTYDDDPEAAIAVIAVTGRWAYSLTPPATIVQATLRLAAWLYHQRDNALDLDRTVIVGGTVLAPAAMPADVLTILRPFQKIVSP
jgi:hypothetical protein